MNQNKYPAGWNLERVGQVLSHYETQTEEEEVAEDEAALEDEMHQLRMQNWCVEKIA